MGRLEKINDFFLKFLAFSISFEYWNPFGLQGVFSIIKMITILYLLTSLPFIKQRFSINYLAKFLIPLWIYLFIEALSSIIHIQYISSYNDIFNINVLQFSVLLIFISNHLTFNNKLAIKLLEVYAYGIIMLSFLFILGIGIDVEFSEGTTRLILFGENPNGIGIKAVIGLLIMLSFIIERRDVKKLKKIIFIISFFLIITMISATASRGALFAFFIGSFIMILLLKKKMSIKIPIVILSGIVAVYLINFFLSNELFYMRIMQTLEEGNTGRDKLWHAAYNIFIDNPTLGVGRSGFFSYMKSYYGDAMGAHNLFLEILATTGIVGFIFFMFFYLRMLKFSYINYIKTKSILFILLFCVITLHVFKAGGAISSTFVWFIFILIIGSTNINTQNTNRGLNLVQ